MRRKAGIALLVAAQLAGLAALWAWAIFDTGVRFGMAAGVTWFLLTIVGAGLAGAPTT